MRSNFARMLIALLWPMIFAATLANCDASPTSAEARAIAELADRRATQGVLDLRVAGVQPDAKSMPVVALDGEWEFVRGRHLPPGSAQRFADGNQSSFARIPSTWPAPVDDHASYRLRVLLPEGLAGETMALRLPLFSTAYRLYANGRLIAQAGEAGASRAASNPEYRKFVRSFRATDSTLELVAHVSNFHHRRGGFIDSVRFGPETKIQNEREIALFMDFFLFGALLIMALYHFGLVLNRRDDLPSLVFGAMCVAVAVRILFTGEYFVTLIFPQMPWVWLLRGEYLTFYIGTPVVLSFFAVIFAERTRAFALTAGWGISAIFVAHLLLTPGRVFSEYLAYFQLFTLIIIVYCVSLVAISIARGKTGAVASFIGGSFFGGAIMHDMLVSQGILSTPFLAPLGLFLFIFAQSYLLSQLFSSAFFAVRRLSDQLQETNNAYSRFVPREFLQFLEKDDITQIQLGDQTQRVMTVLFTDIRSFTNLSERMSPGENFDFLNSYLKRMTPIVREMGGFIDKYIGDSIMALFPEGPDAAIQTAIKMQLEIREYNQQRQERGVPQIEVGMGVHTGSLMLGTIGAEDRMEGTVISDTVNVASRVEGLTRDYGSQILMSTDVREELTQPDQYRMRYLGRVALKGKSANIGIYEILDGLEPESANRLTARDADFARAVDAYQDRRFADAERDFQAVLDQNPQDAAARYFLDRSRDSR